MRPTGGQPVRQAGRVHLASLSTLARPGAEFRRRQALAFLEAETVPQGYSEGFRYANGHTKSNAVLKHDEVLPRDLNIGKIAGAAQTFPKHQWDVELTQGDAGRSRHCVPVGTCKDVLDIEDSRRG